MTEKALRVGPLAGVFGIWAVLSPVAVDLTFLLGVPHLPPELVGFVPHALIALGALSLFIGTLVLVRLRAVDGGVKGRTRLFFGAAAMTIGAIAKIAFGA